MFCHLKGKEEEISKKNSESKPEDYVANKVTIGMQGTGGKYKEAWYCFRGGDSAHSAKKCTKQGNIPHRIQILCDGATSSL